MRKEVNWDEDLMRQLWQASIPPEFRPSQRERRPELELCGASQGISRQQIEKQAAIAKCCIPVRDGDDELIRLFGNGVPLTRCAYAIDICYETARVRLRACHKAGTGRELTESVRSEDEVRLLNFADTFLAKREAYARDCTPKQDGDEDIIRLCAAGVPVREIGKAPGLPRTQAINRLVACHRLQIPVNQVTGSAAMSKKSREKARAAA